MRFLGYLLGFVLLIAGVLYLLSLWSYSDGERAGTISKFSHRGYVFKTWEGTLNVGGFSGETGSLTPQNFDFSVVSDSIAEQVNQAVKTGQRVTLHYEQKLFKLPWNGDTQYFVTKVELVNLPFQRPYGDGSGYPGMQPGMAPQQPAVGQPQPAPTPGEPSMQSAPAPRPAQTVPDSAI
jgi:hypothetical protein